MCLATVSTPVTLTRGKVAAIPPLGFFHLIPIIKLPRKANA